MTLGYKLSKLRRENNYTQEQLADILGVSRQAISKWESDAAYPETDKLIRISELFDCSLDYLLKEQMETDRYGQAAYTQTTQEQAAQTHASQGQASQTRFSETQADREYTTAQTGSTNSSSNSAAKKTWERKSNTILWGMPLWHIGRNAKAVFAVGLNAKGIVAIGLKATGVISFGLLSIGLLASGFLSIGLLSSGLFSFGILSAGCFSVGIFSAGAISAGVISVGAVSFGDFTIGAVATGKYFALGDHAKAMIAIGDSQADGSIYSVCTNIENLSPQEAANIKELLDIHVPKYLAWAKEIIKLFL